MSRIIFLILFCCKCILSEDDGDEEEPIVTFKQGKMKGLVFDNVVTHEKFYAYMGIPFAAPPLGDLRFKPPQEPEGWEGIRESNEDNIEGCLRYNPMFKMTEGEEDCLYLHVFTPKKPEEMQDNLRAVMVWIHGGAFHMGSGSPYNYGPDFLLLQDVVVVLINYRLSVLGFLCTNDSETSGNAGLKDQVMALKWVQSNIKSFGGDPNQVTIFGESAGGASVHFLLLSPTARGLYHRAIAQSGSALNPWALSVNPEESAIKLGNVFDCNTTDINEIIKCLRKPKGEEIATYQYNVLPLDGDMHDYFVYFPCVERPGVEHAFITEHPTDIVMQKKFIDVPFMAGSCLMEMLPVAKLLTARMVPEKMRKTLIKNMNQRPELMIPFHWKINDPAIRKKAGKRIKRFYFQKQPISTLTLENLVNATTDSQFLVGIHNMINYHSDLGKSPVYQYYFTLDTDWGKLKAMLELKDMRGPTHSDELGYLFYLYNSPQKLNQDSIAFQTMTKMTKLWANFAKYGNPTPDPDMGFIWTPSKPDQRFYLEIDKELSVKEYVEEERMNFWEKFRMEENINLL